MTQCKIGKKPRINHYEKDKRWHAIDRLIRPLMPASSIKAALLERHGLTISVRGIYNWRYWGVSDKYARPLAEMLGVPVEEVLRASGRI